ALAVSHARLAPEGREPPDLHAVRLSGPVRGGGGAARAAAAARRQLAVHGAGARGRGGIPPSARHPGLAVLRGGFLRVPGDERDRARDGHALLAPRPRGAVAL